MSIRDNYLIDHACLDQNCVFPFIQGGSDFKKEIETMHNPAILKVARELIPLAKTCKQFNVLTEPVIQKLKSVYFTNVNNKETLMGAHPRYAEISSPIHLAVAGDHIEHLKILLRFGYDVNQPDFTHRTPLEFAQKLGRPNIIKVLTQDPNIENETI